MDKSKQKLLNHVKDNETLSSIGFGLVVVLFAGIMLFNYFKTNRTAQVSSEAEATDSAQLSESTQLPAEYTVAEGDLLWRIAEKYYQSGYNWVDIAKANNIKNPSDLAVGTKLTIPDTKAKEITVSSTEEKLVQMTPVAVTAVVTPQPITTNEYVVAAGDSLWDIAVRAYSDGYAWTKIYQANPAIGANPSLLAIGTKLSIPR